MYPEVMENLREIRQKVADAEKRFGREEGSVRIMAVTKTVPPEKINAAVAEGITLLGENRVQEYLSKKDQYDSSAEVHIIGHLQTNKVKYIIDSVTMIQSVDSIKLAREIDRLAEKHGRVMDILLEVNIGGEESKSGVAEGGLMELAEQAAELKNLRIRGLMAIPPIGAEEALYEEMRKLYEQLKEKALPNAQIDTLSMGMSGDYEIAVKYGSNLIRIGTGLFGARDYTKK
ncbi:MAG: YggS family pyridoxal phosphate-dependent enzyme [Saccharofermentans sp.]|nr:YggS family pyridoxal phosphate-dependent enzyme [Saccharofermentans sp.]